MPKLLLPRLHPLQAKQLLPPLVQRRELQARHTSTIKAQPIAVIAQLRKKAHRLAQLHRRHQQRNKAVTAVLNRARAVKARALSFLEGHFFAATVMSRERVS
jgi:hypothetical protein